MEVGEGQEKVITEKPKKKRKSEIGKFCVFTWKPSVIASPNQTCFFSLMFLLMYQFFWATSG